MSLRKFLFIPLFISLLVFTYFSKSVLESIETLVYVLNFNAALLTALLVAAIFQILGHLMRAQKANYLISPVKQGTLRFHFRALSVGYLFNSILPFRLGELVRARIISGGMSISFSLALTYIIFERAIDAIILGLTGIFLVFLLGGNIKLLAYSIFALSLASIILGVVLLLSKQNRRLLKIWHFITSLFNEKLETSFRFKGWSVIYGLQQSVNRNRLLKYLALTLLSWLLYAASVFVIIQQVIKEFGAADKIIATAAPYFGAAIPAGPANLGVFSDAANILLAKLSLDNSQLIGLNFLTWTVLIIPIGIMGLVLLITKTRELLWQAPPAGSSESSISNKLSRDEDISKEMKNFLDYYFSGNSLSRIVHQLELSKDFRLKKYFKGGSDAITILAIQNKSTIVKKIISIEFEDRLKAQHDWLIKYKNSKAIVDVLDEKLEPLYYSIDLAYDPKFEMMFDYVHRNTLEKSKAVLDSVWSSLNKEVHKNPSKLKLHSSERQAYIDKHIFSCLDKAAAVDVNLVNVTIHKKLIINGKEYDNLYQIIEKIKNHPQAWRDIATYRATESVHGDVILDNLLVSPSGEPLIIDPAPDGNIISGQIFDFGKNLQSLHCGYEFLLRDEDPVHLVGGNSIEYREHRSSKYKQLAEYVNTKLAPQYLSESEQKAMLFHAAALHIRRLKHQVYYTPANTLKFYAVGVKTFNEFLDQYQ